MHEQGVQESAEYAALRGTGVESGACGAAYLHRLGFACQEVQD